MKHIIVLLLFTLSHANVMADDTILNLSCDDFGWSDVEQLVQPYLSDDLHTALVMQAQSSEYRPSAAASQAMANDLPDPVKRILRAIIEKDC